ncbi:hypothetical protein D3C83_170530 [compost metagenome]
MSPEYFSDLNCSAIVIAFRASYISSGCAFRSGVIPSGFPSFEYSPFFSSSAFASTVNRRPSVFLRTSFCSTIRSVGFVTAK